MKFKVSTESGFQIVEAADMAKLLEHTAKLMRTGRYGCAKISFEFVTETASKARRIKLGG